MRGAWICWAVVAGLLRADEPATPETADEQLLRAATIPTDGPGLLAHLRRQALPADRKDRIPLLIRQLGDDSFPVRERASAELRVLGPGVVPHLRRVRQHPDPEVQERVQECLQELERREQSAGTAAAVRLLRVRAPEGAIPVLLSCVGSVTEDAAEEVIATLAQLAGRGDKVNEAVVRALKDPEPATRAAAAVLGRAGTAEHRKAVQALLTDHEAVVRQRAAQGLLAGHDRSAVPVLIDLLAEATPEAAERIREQLCCLARARGPQVGLGSTPSDRKQCKNAWASWWLVARRMDLTRAEVELPAQNATLQALRVVRASFAAQEKADTAALKRLLGVSFLDELGNVRGTREQVDALAEELCASGGGQPVAITPSSVHDRDGLLRRTTAVSVGIGYPVLRGFVSAIPREELRALQVQRHLSGGSSAHLVLLRVSDGRARVVGQRIVDRR
jgi:hypothetical protein